jgi:hypothetical protein
LHNKRFCSNTYLKTKIYYKTFILNMKSDDRIWIFLIHSKYFNICIQFRIYTNDKNQIHFITCARARNLQAWLKDSSIGKCSFVKSKRTFCCGGPLISNCGLKSPIVYYRFGKHSKIFPASPGSLYTSCGIWIEDAEVIACSSYSWLACASFQ